MYKHIFKVRATYPQAEATLRVDEKQKTAEWVILSD